MKEIISLIFKTLRKIKRILLQAVYIPIARLVLFCNNANVGKKLNVNGFLKVDVTRRGNFSIGNNVCINSGKNHNVIGRQQKSIFWVEGNLKIGHNVGMSATAIICNHNISIGNNVTIGGNTVIYDTDFHNLNPLIRANKLVDKDSAIKLPVIIKNNVFIGAHSTILKGVTIGENSIIGACSVVTKDIPDNEIWAGNPARKIKEL